MRAWAGLVCGLGLALTGSVAAQEWVGDAIPRPLTDRIGDPKQGRSIVTSRQTGLCLLCHSGPFPEERFQGDLAPNLALSVANLSAAQIRARLVDPSRANPATIMPSYYRTDHLKLVAKPYEQKTLLTAQEIEDVVAFLMTLK